MHCVIFGLTISSSWGNGHATLWRALLKAMARRGHTVSFYERVVPYYAANRDELELPRGVRVHLYDSLDKVRIEARRELATADLAMCSSYCPDGPAASALILESNAAVKAFYDLDTPVTLQALSGGARVDYLPDNGLSDFDLVLSYTGGRALTELQTRLGAQRVAPLYGWVDPEMHRPMPAMPEFRAALSYLGTYAADRQRAIEELFLRPAQQLPGERFVMGGAQYPDAFPWSENVFFVRHLPPSLHASFYCSSRATLNVTRGAMAEYGYCPSGRLFEAAACGAPLLTDFWEGLETFFTPGEELLRVATAKDVLDALSLSDGELRRIADAGRARTLADHTADRRVDHLEALLCGQDTTAVTSVA
jgi:spore maturation protein CgeB